MSPDNLLKDPTLVGILLGAVGKTRDFVITKGLAVGVTLIFTTGGMYYQFNSLNLQMEKMSIEMKVSNERINSLEARLESQLIATNGRIDVVTNKVENVKETITEWMRLYGPRRLSP